MNTVAFFYFSSSFNLLMNFRLADLTTVLNLRVSYKNIGKLTLILSLMTIILLEVEVTLALQFGNTGSKVIELQKKLRDKGYFEGPITGYYGSLTQAAVKQFQLTNRLQVDGIAGRQTLAALGLTDAIASPTAQQTTLLQLGSSGSEVIALQQHLQVLGYYNKPITGFYDIFTQQAVKLFQKNVGLNPDGIAGPLTQAALESEFNSLSVSGSSLTPPIVPKRGNFR